MLKKNRGPEVPSGSMADIAFLLLIFFLVTTSIVSNVGLLIVLPQAEVDEVPVPIHERNLFNIRINSSDRVMAEGELVEDITSLRARVTEFVLNPEGSELLADSPKDAVVSLKSDRGTSQKMYIAVLDEVQGAYNDIYSERAGITNNQWRQLMQNLNDPANAALYRIGRGVRDDGTVAIPMNISIAENPMQLTISN